MWFEVQLRSQMLQGSAYVVHEIINSTCQYVQAHEGPLKTIQNIVRLDPDIVKVKFLVNKFDKEIFGSR